jgi:hypothetical protein
VTDHRSLGYWALTALLLWGGGATAHVPPLAGKLVDCVARSDLVVAGTVERIVDVKTRMVETTVRIERIISGEVRAERVTFHGSARFAPRERYVVFLRRRGGGFEGVQGAGTLFTSRPEEDAVYERTVVAIAQALRAAPPVHADQLRLALIPALRKSPPPLRYHAALELGALAHHGALSAESRRALEDTAGDAGLDPALKGLVATLLREEPAADGRQ